MILTPIKNAGGKRGDSEREPLAQSMPLEVEESPFLSAVHQYLKEDKFGDLKRKDASSY